MSDKKVPDGFTRIQFDKREPRRDVCVYCLHKKNSRDHLPPDNLFPTGMRVLDMRTVPCCVACNNSFSEDDDWFRNIMAAFCADQSQIARDLLTTKVARSGAKRPDLLKKVSNRQEWVDQFSKGGIIIGRKKEHMPFTRDEEGCITRVLHRLCKGYHWVIYKHPAPLNSRVKLMVVQSMPQVFLDALGASQWISSGNPDVFMWTALPVTLNEPLCFFWFTFYRKFSMIVLFYKDTKGNIFGRIPSSPLYVPQ